MFPLFVGFLCLVLVFYAVLSVFSSFAIVSLGKSWLLKLSSCCHRSFSFQCLFLAMSRVGLQCVILVFLGHTHLLFDLDQAVQIVGLIGVQTV